MFSTLISISSLFLSFALLCLGNGLQNTLISLRAVHEGYDNMVIGLMTSFFFVGFFMGTSVAQKYIERVGHIRTFVALASVLSTVSLMHVLVLAESFWIGFRFIYGFSIAGLYMVIESWLNELSNSKNRGKIMSVYMIVYFLSLALSQLFFEIDDGTKFILFAVVSILISLSLVPLSLSKAKQPVHLSDESFSFKKMYKTSPLATIAAIFYGMITGSFWGLGAVYLSSINIDSNQVAKIISVTLLGGLVFQWIIGYISDMFNRRIAIALCCFISLIFSLIFANVTEYGGWLIFIAFIFGGFTHPLYSLIVSLANDFVKAGNFVKVSATLLNLNAIGSIIGPILVGYLMSISDSAFFYFLAFANFVILAFTIYRMNIGRKIPENTVENFTPLPKTSNVLFNMDPRYDENDVKK